MTPAYAESPETVDARETIAVGGMAAAAALAGMYWLMRAGFPNPAAPILGALGLIFFLLATPVLIQRQHRRTSRWWKSQPAITIYLMVLTMLPGMLADERARILGPAVAVAGFLGGGLLLVRWLRQGSWISSLLFVTGSAVFAIWGGGVMWATRYKMPLFWETLSFRSNVHHDPLYMTAIGNMLDVYGVPSTGLDGIPRVRYHFGSSWLLTQWAELTGTDSLSFYSLGYAVVLFPLFFAGLFLFALETRKAFFGEVSWRPLRTDWILFAVLAVAVIGFLPNDAMDAVAIWNGHALGSESYLAGLAFCVLAAAVMANFWHGASAEPFVSATIFFVVAVPIAIVASGLLKLSLMVLTLAAMLYLVVRLGLWKRIPVVVGAFLSLLLAAVTYTIVALPEHNTGVAPFSFMMYQVETGWQQFFPMLHLLLTWVYVAGRLWEERTDSWAALAFAARERRLIDVEVLLVVAVVGIIPGAVISIHGGSAVFFSDVQRWLALSLILARLGTWVGEYRLRRARHVDPPTAPGWRTVRLSWVLALVVAGPFAITVAYNTIQWPLRSIRSNVNLRRQLVALAKGDSTLSASVGKTDMLDSRLLADGLQKTAYYPIVNALRDVAALPSSVRKEALLFIPQSYSAYWDMLTDDGRCVFTPLVAPAVASIALVDGMPRAGCQMTDQYNMTAYTPRSATQSAEETTDESVCRKAASKGFSRVLVLAGDDRRHPEVRRLECPQAGAGDGKS